MENMEDHEIKKAVRDSYARVAVESSSCCGPKSCCGEATDTAGFRSKQIGYSDEDLSAVPDGANLGLGCGNPVAIASLVEGERVLDLGSGAGFDCFLAAAKVGPSGHVIGVDMTPEMIDKARVNAEKGEAKNVEFRLGTLEHLPVADGEVDVVISNCVINLVPDKGKTFAEAFRALAPGGRLMVSDLVLLQEWPDEIPKTVEAYAGCLAGAVLKDEYLAAMERVGLEQIEVVEETSASELLGAITEDVASSLNIDLGLIEKFSGAIASVKVSAVKPA